MSSPSRSILSSLFGIRSNDNAASDASDGIQVGDRFYKVGRWESIWVVQRLFKPDGNNALHAKIVRDGHAGDVTIISTEVLMDDTAYRPDRRTREEHDKKAPGKSLSHAEPLGASRPLCQAVRHEISFSPILFCIQVDGLP